MSYFSLFVHFTLLHPVCVDVFFLLDVGIFFVASYTFFSNLLQRNSFFFTSPPVVYINHK